MEKAIKKKKSGTGGNGRSLGHQAVKREVTMLAGGGGGGRGGGGGGGSRRRSRGDGSQMSDPKPPDLIAKQRRLTFSFSFSRLLLFFSPSKSFPSEPALCLRTLLLLPSVIHVSCVCVYSFCPVKDALISALDRRQIPLLSSLERGEGRHPEITAANKDVNVFFLCIFLFVFHPLRKVKKCDMKQRVLNFSLKKDLN